MQCVNCGFQNMPGFPQCGRCGSPLDLNALDIDVNPPRASRSARRIRAVTPRRTIYKARDVAVSTAQAVRDSMDNAPEIELGLDLPTGDVLARMIVPGWAQLYVGRRPLGWTFLGTWLLLLVAGLVEWGSFEGSVFLGLALAVHTSSILSIVMLCGRSITYRLLIGFGISMLLMLTIYRPPAWVLSHVATFLQFQRDSGVFERGDVLFYNSWARLSRGDLVLVTGNNSRIQDELMQRRGNGDTIFRIQENEIVDRLVGLSGDRVVWDGKRLLVNNEAMSWTPLQPGVLPSRLELVVPPGRCLVLPTTSQVANPAMEEGRWAQLGMVDLDQILGQVYLRRYPFRRFTWLR